VPDERAAEINHLTDYEFEIVPAALSFSGCLDGCALNLKTLDAENVVLDSDARLSL
jgi:hypothetical protein